MLGDSEKIDIVIVTWNALPELRRCLKSIQRHTPPSSYTLTVVDNGTTDGTQRWLEKRAERLPFKHVRLSKNLGIASASNAGIRSGKNKWILRLDDDAQVGPGWLSKLYKETARQPKIGIIGCQILFPNSRLFSAEHLLPNLTNAAFELDRGQHRYIRSVESVTGTCLLMRRKLLNDLHGFDPVLSDELEDVDLCLRARVQGWRVLYVGTVSVTHHSLLRRRTQRVSKNRSQFKKRWKNFPQFPLRDSHPVDRLHLQLHRALGANQTAKAEKKIFELKRYGLEGAAAQSLYGLLLLERGETKSAGQIFQKEIRRSDSPLAWAGLAVVERRNGNHDKSRRYFRHASKIHPKTSLADWLLWARQWSLPKIVAVCGSKDVGGEQALLVNFGREFLRQGIDWQVISLDPSGAMRRFYTKEGLPCRCIANDTRALKTYFQKSKPDFVETSAVFAGTIARAARQAGIPLIWKVVVDPKRFVDEPFWQSHRAEIQKAAVQVVALSGRFLPTLRKIIRCKMSVIPSVIDPREFSPERLRCFRKEFRKKFSLSDDAFAVGMGANFTPRKRHGDFVLAALKVHTILPKARFFVFGNAFRGIDSTNRYRRSVKDLTHRSGAADFIEIHPMQKKFLWSAGLDLFVLPSEGEGHSMAILEAFAARLPVVAARSGGTPDLVGPGRGILVSPRKPDELAEAILALQSKSKRSALAGRAHQAVCKNFDVKSWSEKWMNHLRSP